MTKIEINKYINNNQSQIKSNQIKSIIIDINHVDKIKSKQNKTKQMQSFFIYNKTNQSQIKVKSKSNQSQINNNNRYQSCR